MKDDGTDPTLRRIAQAAAALGAASLLSTATAANAGAAVAKPAVAGISSAARGTEAVVWTRGRPSRATASATKFRGLMPSLLGR
jgi:hypothetical protein